MQQNLVRPDVVGPVLARALGDSRGQRPQAGLIPGGKSNLTFELTSEAGGESELTVHFSPSPAA